MCTPSNTLDLRQTIRAVVAATMLTASASAQSGEPAPVSAPGEGYSVLIVQEPMPGADEAIDCFTLQIMADNRLVASEPTSGYVLAEHWSVNGKYVAVNNRRGNSGDYLWIFTLPDGRCIKRPDDAIGREWEIAALHEIAAKIKGADSDHIDRDWLTADGWTPSGELILKLQAKYSGLGTFTCTGLAEIKEGRPALKSLTMEKLED